jgi:signal transduction histidine kinase
MPQQLSVFVEAAENVLAAIEGGEAASAAAANRNEVERAFRALEQELQAEQSAIEDNIAATESTAGLISLFTQATVTLLIPVTALGVYRTIVRRQVRERGMAMQARLDAEREVSKAKDEFIAGLSHEFRTPLTSIYGFSELLIESGALDPAMSLELIGLINVESAELSRMVDDLLAAARIESDAITFQPSTIDLQEQLDLVVAPFVRADRTIEVDLARSAVVADPLRLRQVLRNLVSNAVKHGGSTVAVFGRADGDRYVCSVADDGAGVPTEIEARMFERFVHDGRQALLVGSVGLGLGIAKSLLEGMGGTLEYERRGDGTFFTFTLPLASGDAAPPKPGDPGIVVELALESAS